MKNYFLYLILLLSHFNTLGINWNWAISAKSCNSDAANDIVTDKSGNIYLTLQTGQGCTLNINNDSLPSLGSFPLSVVVKFDPNGNVIWMREIGAPGSCYLQGLAVDSAGRVDITGWYNSPIVVIGSDTLYGSGSSYLNSFVSQLDSSGNILWTLGSSSFSYGHAVDLFVDPIGNIYVFGNFNEPTFTMGGTTHNSNTSQLRSDIYILKLSSSGAFDWIKSFGDPDDEQVFAACMDKSNNLIFTGTKSISGQEDILVIKLDSSGNLLWQETIPVHTGCTSNDVVTDDNNNVYVAGSVNNAIVFNSTLYPLNGWVDAFVASFSSAGTERWLKKFNASTSDYCYGLGMHRDRLYTIGMFIDSTLSLGNHIIFNDSTGTNAFMAVFDTSGNDVDLFSIGEELDECGISITCDLQGNVIAAGVYGSERLIFSPDTLVNALPNANVFDVFIAKTGGIILNSEQLTENDINIFPNPSSSYIFVTGVNNFSYRLYNSIGVICSEDKSKDRIDVSSLAKGIYFMELWNGNSKYMKRVCVIH